MAIEEPSYTVIERADDFELRRYEPYVVAETLVSGEFSEVGNEGFRRLVAYISGSNRSKESIDMTAPVNQQPSAEKIEMTAPVSQQAKGASYRITFVMPADYTLDTLPEPLDERIRLQQEPAQLVAAIRYSGTWSQSRYQENLAKLRAVMVARDLRAVGEPIFARYNSPFALWFQVPKSGATGRPCPLLRKSRLERLRTCSGRCRAPALRMG